MISPVQIHADNFQSPSCPSRAWKWFPGLFAPSPFLSRDWGEADEPVVLQMLLLALLEHRSNVFFLPVLMNLLQCPSPFKGIECGLSDIGQLLKHPWVQPLNSHGIVQVQAKCSPSLIQLCRVKSSFLQSFPVALGTSNSQRRVLPAKAETKAALSASAFSVSSASRSPAPLSTEGPRFP